MVPGYWQFASVLVFVFCENSVAFLDRNCNQRDQFCFVERSTERFRLDHQPSSTSSKRLVESVKNPRRSEFHSAEDSRHVRENRNVETDVRSSEFRYRQEQREISEQSRFDRRNVRDRRDIQSRLDRQNVRNPIDLPNERSRAERNTNRDLRRVDSARKDQFRLTRDSRNGLRHQKKQERNQRLDRVKLNRRDRIAELRNSRAVNREEESSLRRRNTYGNQIRARLQVRSYSINRSSKRYASTHDFDVSLIQASERYNPRRIDNSRRVGIIRELELNRKGVEREIHGSFNTRREDLRMREVREGDVDRLSGNARQERRMVLQNRRDNVETLRRERLAITARQNLERDVRGSANTRREDERVTDRREQETREEDSRRIKLMQRDSRETKHREQRIREQTEDRRQKNIRDSRHSRIERIQEVRDQRREIRDKREKSVTRDRLDRREEARVDRRSSSLEMERRNEQRNQDRPHVELYRHDFRKERENVRGAERTSRQLTRNSEEQRRFSGDISRATRQRVELRQDVTREIAREVLRRESRELSRRVTSQRLSDQPQSKAANEYMVQYPQIPFAQILQALLIGALVIKTMMQHEIASKKLSSNIIVGKLVAALQKIKSF